MASLDAELTGEAVTPLLAAVEVIKTGAGVELWTVTSPFDPVELIKTGAGVDVSTVTWPLATMELTSTLPVAINSDALVVLVYWSDWPTTKGELNSDTDVAATVEVMTVTGGQVGQSWVAVRTSFEFVDVPGTTGKQVGHSLVIVSIEVGGDVVVTGGQLWQNCVTVSIEVDALTVTGGQVGHGWLTLNT